MPSVPSVSPRFVASLSAMIDHAVAQCSHAVNGGRPAWFRGQQSTWSGEVLDVDAIASAFDRSSIGEAYSEAVAGGGTVGAAASSKMQSDYLAMMERSFRMRHLSPVRSALHAATRRLGHSDTNRGVIARVGKYAQDLLLDGSA
jgi:hypothetical protein